MSEKLFTFANCPICSHSVITTRLDLKPTTFEISPAKFHLASIRKQKGGRQGGFFKVEGKNIVELWNSKNPEQRAIAEFYKQRVLQVVRAYHDAGIISETEL